MRRGGERSGTERNREERSAEESRGAQRSVEEPRGAEGREENKEENKAEQSRAEQSRAEQNVEEHDDMSPTPLARPLFSSPSPTTMHTTIRLWNEALNLTREDCSWRKCTTLGGTATVQSYGAGPGCHDGNSRSRQLFHGCFSASFRRELG